MYNTLIYFDFMDGILFWFLTIIINILPLAGNMFVRKCTVENIISKIKVIIKESNIVLAYG